MPTQRFGRRCFAGFIALALTYIILGGIINQATRTMTAAEMIENEEWIDSGKLWIDRQMCRWIGICGLFHYLNKSGWTWQHIEKNVPVQNPDWNDFWTSGEDPESWSDEERELREIPQYVFDYAPYVHLFSGENYWPCDIAEHLVHTTPYANYTLIEELEDDRNLTNLNELNGIDGGHSGKYIYLQSNDNVEEQPRWLGGEKNIPNAPEFPTDGHFGKPWPNLGDLKDFDLEGAQQQVLKAHNEAASINEANSAIPRKLRPTQDGQCGGNSGLTCEGSAFGQCCSIYGYCGQDDGYCGEACDPLAGKCPDPLRPTPGPHRELRKRDRDPSERHRPEKSGRSSAPAILVVVPKEDGIVDAFWFFFYSYNLGNTVLNVRFGNHVGDWEHTAVRFVHGKPEYVYLSEHNFGEAYDYSAVEKYLPAQDGTGTMLGTWSNATAARRAKRPVVYSATGSHAMYATPGLHPYVLPWGLLHDQSDRGPLWDPAQNAHAFVYDHTTQVLRASTHSPKAPVDWFHYAGHWGDKYYPLSDPRQYRFAGEYHYVNGPTGPKFKNLGRDDVCQGRGPCKIRHWLGGGRGADHFPEEEEIEEGGLPGGNMTDTI